MQIMKLSTHPKIFTLAICALATAFSFAMGDGNRNLLLIVLMMLTPIHFALQFPIYKVSDKWPYLFYVTLILCALFNAELLRISSVAYTLLFLLLFLYILRIVKSGVISLGYYLNLLRYLLYAYLVVLLVQQACVLFGLPFVFNQINSVENEAFKLNILSPEPSHAARILTVVMYSYVLMREVINGRPYSLVQDFSKDRKVWLAFLYPMLTMGSGAAYFFLPLFGLKFVRLKNTLILFFVLIPSAWIASQFSITPLDRAIAFSKSVVTLDEKKIIEADHSASFRIVPTILYLKSFDLLSLKTWVGNGTDYDVKLFPKIIPGLPEGQGAGGIFPTLFLNYGIITGLIFLVFVFRVCFDKLFSHPVLLWLVLIGPVPINTQLVWLSIVLFAVNKYFHGVGVGAGYLNTTTFRSLTGEINKTYLMRVN